MNKKASAQDVIFIAAILFVLSIGIFVIAFMANTSVDKLTNTTAINSSTAAKTALLSLKTTPYSFSSEIVASGGMSSVIENEFV